MFRMLTNKDLKQISDLFDEKIEKISVILKGNFDRIDKRFDNLEGRFAVMEDKFDKLSFRVDKNHDRRIEMLEDSMRIVKSKLSL